MRIQLSQFLFVSISYEHFFISRHLSSLALVGQGKSLLCLGLHAHYRLHHKMKNFDEYCPKSRPVPVKTHSVSFSSLPSSLLISLYVSRKMAGKTLTAVALLVPTLAFAAPGKTSTSLGTYYASSSVSCHQLTAQKNRQFLTQLGPTHNGQLLHPLLYLINPLALQIS